MLLNEVYARSSAAVRNTWGYGDALLPPVTELWPCRNRPAT